jgi:DnaK suppressor protein
MVVRKPEVLRAFLEGEQERLRAVIAQTETEAGENLGYGNHQADDASEAFEQAKELALHQNAQRLLLQVDAALARFDQGSYGLCTHCGEEIDPARLEALPYVALCMRCQQRLNP